MSEEKAQVVAVQRSVTLRLPQRMRLAASEQERLWKGLERFVNCGDDLADYQALGRAWPDLWPKQIFYWGEPPSDPEIPTAAPTRNGLEWHPVCRELFLIYRDALRAVWKPRDKEGFLARIGFLMGLSNDDLDSFDVIRMNPGAKHICAMPSNPDAPYCAFIPHACDAILQHFPTANAGPVETDIVWEDGIFLVVPRNDFGRALYLLFRQSWRARVCPRCKIFFVARKPKQIFCGTGCSAGNRLDSKRKWWNRVGAKRRAKQRQQTSGRSRAERKSQ